MATIRVRAAILGIGILWDNLPILKHCVVTWAVVIQMKLLATKKSCHSDALIALFGSS